MTALISWLIQRLGWVYGFVVNTLHLPSQVGYVTIVLLVFVFFYDLYDIYQNRRKGAQPLYWLIVVLIVPLGTLIYLVFGRKMLHDLPAPLAPVEAAAPEVIDPNAPVVVPAAPPQKKTATTIGSIVAIIAMVAGAVAIGFFILIGIALIQCANDPKCM